MDDETKTEENELKQFLNEEIDRNKKAIRTTGIVGLIVILLVACYMFGTVILVRSMLEPMTAARMIGEQIELNLPSVLNETEQALQLHAPVLANTLSQSVMDALPKVRREAEKQIDSSYQELLPLIRQEMLSTFHTYVNDHREEITDYYETQKSPDFAKFFVDEVISEMTGSLNRELRQDSRGRDLVHVQVASLNALKEVNEELSRLLQMKPEEMTRSERLQRRLIVTWIQALDELLCSQYLVE